MLRIHTSVEAEAELIEGMGFCPPLFGSAKAQPPVFNRLVQHSLSAYYDLRRPDDFYIPLVFIY